MPAFSSEERQLLDDSLRDLLADRYTFEHQLKLARTDEADGFGRAEWSTYAEMGWLGIALPDSAGGSGGGATELGIVMAAAGRFLLLEPFLGTLVLGAAAIERAGTPAQQTLLAEIVAGTRLLAFCHSEPDAGFARDYVRTIARRDGAGYVLDGEKTHVIAAHAVDTLVVSARLGSASGPLALFLVPRTADGVRISAAPALDGRRGGAVALTGVRVPADAKLGSGDADQTGLIGEILDRGAIAVCAEAVGAMAAVTQITVDYLKTRQQFGQLLSKFQVLQHRLVDMSVTTEEARAIVHAALQAIDDGNLDARRAIWRAKVKTAQCARFVGGQAIQLHGGMGMTDELVVGHYYKRLAMCETLLGDAEWYLKQLAAEGPA
jgi:alkylation response protein AidB-like acyl-CoA dehydrogenase